MTRVPKPAPGVTSHLLTRREVAAVYGVTADTVDRWAREGRLTRAGRGRYYRDQVTRKAAAPPEPEA